MRFDGLAGRSVVIWGAGREGRAALVALAEAGVSATIAVTGDGPVPDDLKGVALRGARAMAALETADVVIKSPGVPRASDEFKRVIAAGAEITSLMAIWLAENSDRVIAVTGTKGKSTTATIVRHLLDAAGFSAVLVGNIGTPVTVDDATTSGVAVAEVSSYQAADVTTSPQVAIVTSLYPEHLPWHGGFEEYVRDKLNLVAHGSKSVVVPGAPTGLIEIVQSHVGSGTAVITPGEFGISVSPEGLTWADVGILKAEESPLRGAHNLSNIALAIAAVCAHASSADLNRLALLEAAKRLRPLAYRLEPVPSADARYWVDDSLATAPEAVVAALQTFEDKPVTLLAGGADRGISFAPLVDYLSVQGRRGAVNLVLVGPAGQRMRAHLADAGIESRLAPDFSSALGIIRSSAGPHDVVLLSPGAPSFDEFANYEQRSAAFRHGALAVERP